MLTFARKLIYVKTMLELRLQVDLPKNQCEINHSDSFQLWGSCFADNIGEKLTENKFSCDMNPFGTLYNPISIATAIRELLENKKYTKGDLSFGNSQWFSYMHHSSFSSADNNICLNQINSRLIKSRKNLSQADWIIFTWGSAWVYKLKTNGQIVGNCHKMPDKYFNRIKLEVNEIVDAYSQLIQDIRLINPKAKFIFTVSPIRHAKDGFHGNQVSKSTLLLASDKLCNKINGCKYFPSYEIMMDELRDYRFYADDMIHPTPLAIKYIWECFSRTYFTNETKRFITDWEKIKKGLSHRPFDSESDLYQHFLGEILLKIEHLKEKMPYLDVENEIKICQAQLKK